jgi:AraC-like DNA-binding protein
VYEERLFTIVAARIIPSDIERVHPQELISQLVGQYRGKMVHYNQDTFIAIFEGPSKAVHCSIDLVGALKSMHTQLAVGIHIKEAVVDEAHFISDRTENFIASILNQANPNQILITQAVKFLLSGAGLTFGTYKTIFETNNGESHPLFLVTDHLETKAQFNNFNTKQLPQNHSFLENVLQSIDTHMNNESFGVEMLCNEMNLSERQMQRKLKAITNKSPNQLISSVRLHRAKELLLNQKDNIAEIAFQTGFANPSYFSKCFKKGFGISPSDLLL